MFTTLAPIFITILDREAVSDLAYRLQAVERLRQIHPADLCRALVECCHGDEKRTIASARRCYARISGFSPEESAFYQRFNQGLVNLPGDRLRHLMSQAPDSSRPLLGHLLNQAGLADLLAPDASRFSLPSWAAKEFPSTDDRHGGVKLTALLSVLCPRLTKVIVTDARRHDRKAVKLPRWLHGLLILMDRGYCDRRLFAQIEDRCGFFLTRLKKNWRPLVTAIRSGPDQCCVGQPVSGELPFQGPADPDVSFTMADATLREFRVVRLTVGYEQLRGRQEPVVLTFVTNLAPDQFSIEQLATLYRFRWEVERLFAIAKGVGRLVRLRSGNRQVVEAFVYASLLAIVSGLRVCAWMRSRRPNCEPSAWRVCTPEAEWLPSLAQALGQPAWHRRLTQFERALWREGVNPNPGRHYTGTDYTFELAWQGAYRPSPAND
jgi:putative transposase